MFEGLAEQVDELDVPLDGAALAELVAIHDRLLARLSEAAGEFDAAKLWDVAGERSMAGWLQATTKTDPQEAGRLLARARRLRRLPVTAAAWRTGGLSTGQVNAVTAIVKPRHLDLFAQDEAGLVPRLCRYGLADTVTALHQWVRDADALVDDPEPDEAKRELHVSRTFGGERVVRGHFDRDAGQMLEVALRLASTKDGGGEPPRSAAYRRADAMYDICKYFVDNQTSRSGGSNRAHLNVIVTHDDLAAGRGGQYADGTPIDGISLSTLVCDCTIHRVLVDAENARIDYGRETKTINAALRTALIVRDGGCRYPGCDRPATYTDGHHVHWWRHGGPTNLHNIVSLCRGHHRVLHKPGWNAALDPNGTLHITDPTGRTRTTHPPGFTAGRRQAA